MIETNEYKMIRFMQSAKKNKLITTQQFKTLKGQVLSGDLDGAEKGFIKLIKKSNKVTVG